VRLSFSSLIFIEAKYCQIFHGPTWQHWQKCDAALKLSQKNQKSNLRKSWLSGIDSSKNSTEIWILNPNLQEKLEWIWTKISSTHRLSDLIITFKTYPVLLNLPVTQPLCNSSSFYSAPFDIYPCKPNSIDSTLICFSANSIQVLQEARLG
jgi:hypothetical protein